MDVDAHIGGKQIGAQCLPLNNMNRYTRGLLRRAPENNAYARAIRCPALFRAHSLRPSGSVIHHNPLIPARHLFILLLSISRVAFDIVIQLRLRLAKSVVIIVSAIRARPRSERLTPPNERAAVARKMVVVVVVVNSEAERGGQ